MYGLGVIVNGLVIVGASFAALILKKFIMKFDKNNKVRKNKCDTIMSGLALCIIYMGISGALECQPCAYMYNIYGSWRSYRRTYRY